MIKYILISIKYDMTSLSITLPDNIAKESNIVAKKLGVSRTQFIRQAIIHELNNYQFQTEQAGIIKSFDEMKKSKLYLDEMLEMTETINSDLPEERTQWWKK